MRGVETHITGGRGDADDRALELEVPRRTAKLGAPEREDPALIAHQLIATRYSGRANWCTRVRCIDRPPGEEGLVGAERIAGPSA